MHGCGAQLSRLQRDQSPIVCAFTAHVWRMSVARTNKQNCQARDFFSVPHRRAATSSIASRFDLFSRNLPILRIFGTSNTHTHSCLQVTPAWIKRLNETNIFGFFHFDRTWSMRWCWLICCWTAENNEVTVRVSVIFGTSHTHLPPFSNGK